MPFVATNPYTGQPLATVPALDSDALEHLLAGTHARQQQWRACALEERARFIAALGTALTTRREALAQALTREMGKPIAAARAEVDKCVLLCTQAPAMATAALASETLIDDTTAWVSVRYDALGVVLAIMPWNFPYWQALRFAVPALLAGNGVLIKPAPSVPGSAGLLAECLDDARAAAPGVPPAPCAIACIEQDDIAAVIADDRIVGVTLTGSERAGRHVAEVAGAYLKKVVLELGGSDPFIVLPDADIEQAATVAVTARTVNSGQSCIAAKRFIVCESVYDAFVTHFTDQMRRLVVGDPTDERTQIGPIATRAVRDALAAQVDDAIAHGARALLGGRTPDTPGFFYPPTVLVDVPEMARATREELFGPVAVIYRVPDEAAAVARANATAFGLGASVWTRDPVAAERCIAALDAGMVFVNEMVVSDPRLPFGGVKHSGVGRELGPIGYREFTNPKTVRLPPRRTAPR